MAKIQRPASKKPKGESVLGVVKDEESAVLPVPTKKKKKGKS